MDLSAATQRASVSAGLISRGASSAMRSGGGRRRAHTVRCSWLPDAEQTSCRVQSHWHTGSQATGGLPQAPGVAANRRTCRSCSASPREGDTRQGAAQQGDGQCLFCQKGCGAAEGHDLLPSCGAASPSLAAGFKCGRYPRPCLSAQHLGCSPNGCPARQQPSMASLCRLRGQQPGVADQPGGGPSRMPAACHWRLMLAASCLEVPGPPISREHCLPERRRLCSPAPCSPAAPFGSACSPSVLKFLAAKEKDWWREEWRLSCLKRWVPPVRGIKCCVIGGQAERRAGRAGRDLRKASGICNAGRNSGQFQAISALAAPWGLWAVVWKPLQLVGPEWQALRHVAVASLGHLRLTP